MAQAFDTLSRDTSIEMEKLGVIAGFLLGLVLAVGVLGVPMSDAGTPTWLTVTAVFLLVAVATRAGLALGRAIGRKG